jgi:hypothetical protein
MRLVRYGRLGAEKPGVIGADGKLRALASLVTDITPELLAPASLRQLKKRLDVARLPAVSGHPRSAARSTASARWSASGSTTRTMRPR